MRLRRWAAALAVALLCVGFFNPPSLAAGFPNPHFQATSVTEMSGLNGAYIHLVNQDWPWAHYGFYKVWFWPKPCGQQSYDRWGCWIYTRPWQRHWGYLGYDGWHVTRRWESYQYWVNTSHWSWDPTYQWINSGYWQPYTAYRTVEEWEVVKPAYTTTAYKQVLVQKSGWLTITQNVWEPGNTPSGTPTKWYAIAVPQWMVNWGYNPAALDGTPNPGSITPGPTSPGPTNGGKMVQETTRYWGTWLTTKTVSYLVHHPATYGWVAVQQAYTAYRWVNTSHWQGTWVWVVSGYWATAWHWVTVRYWGPEYGWIWGYRGPGQMCRTWYGSQCY